MASQRNGMTPAAFGELQRRRVLEFIRTYQQLYISSPTVAEIAAGVGIAAGHARNHVQKLVDAGRLERTGVRSLRILDPEFAPPTFTDTPWTVVDTKAPIGGRTKVLGRFATEELGAKFIELLPEYETGRYGLDGPTED